VPTETLPTVCPVGESDNLVSFENFEIGNNRLRGWTNGKLNTLELENFSTFLGRYGNATFAEMPIKTFPISPRASHVVVKFDLYEIDSWDGNVIQPDHGPDFFELRMSDNGGAPYNDIIRMYLSQDSPDPTSGTSEGGDITWSMTSGPMDFLGFRSIWLDQKHDVEVVIPASFFVRSNDLTVEFFFRTTSNINDESGGIDNVRVTNCFSAG